MKKIKFKDDQGELVEFWLEKESIVALIQLLLTTYLQEEEAEP